MEALKVYLDDERQTPEGWTRTYTAQETIELLKNENVSHLSLDHDLGPPEAGTGYDVLLWLEEMIHCFSYEPPSEISVHSANPVGRKKMEMAITSIYRGAKKHGLKTS